MQTIKWQLTSGQPETLVAGEVRKIAISTSPNVPTSATYAVTKKSDGSSVVASAAATVDGSTVSCLLTVPAATTDTLRVTFLYVVGTETLAACVEVPVAPA